MRVSVSLSTSGVILLQARSGGGGGEPAAELRLEVTEARTPVMGYSYKELVAAVGKTLEMPKPKS